MASGEVQSEWANIKQVVAECFTKILHTILESRIPNFVVQGEAGRSDLPSHSTLSTSQLRPSQKWFNLVLSDSPIAFQVAEPWRRNIFKPMVVDIFLLQPKERSLKVCGVSRVHKVNTPLITTLRGDDVIQEAKIANEQPESAVVKTLLERWIVHYDAEKSHDHLFSIADKRAEGHHMTSMSGGLRTTSPRSSSELSSVYKKAVVLLRSLYCIVRILPAHHLFRLANANSESCNFTLDFGLFTVASPLSLPADFAMTPRIFSPVETKQGRFCLSVAYQHAAAITALEVISPIRPRIIPDYVEQATINPLGKFAGPCQGGSLHTGALSGRRKVHVVSVASGFSMSPLSLESPSHQSWRHSWSEEKLQPGMRMPLNTSPSSCPSVDYFPDTRKFTMEHSASSRSPPVVRLPTTALSHDQRNAGSQPLILQDKYRFSPSPPADSHSNNYLFQGPQSAPVRMQSQGFRKKETTSNIERSPLPPLFPRVSPESSSQGTSKRLSFQSGQIQHRPRASFERDILESSLESDPADLTLPYLPQNRHHIHHITGDEKIEGRMSKPYSHRLSTSFSRSTSKSSIEDDLELPFLAEGMEADEYLGRSDTSGHSEPSKPSAMTFQSQDAAVGALVRILKSAPPLCQSSNISVISTSPQHDIRSVLPVLGDPSRKEEISRRFKSAGAQRHCKGLLTSETESSKKTCKTTNDALEELHGYQELKEFLQKQSGQNSV